MQRPLLASRLSRWLMVVLMALLSTSVAWAQITANYVFTSATNGSLALDRNGNAVDMSTGTTQLVAAGLDNSASSVVTLPFTFVLQGQSYTQFSASSNGLVALGSSAIGSSTYTVSSGTATAPLIGAFAGDLSTAVATGKVHYKIVGTSPNRTLVVEFLNMSLLYLGTPTADGTYQTRLYEGTGIVEFVYGPMMRNAGTSAGNSQQVGIGFAAGSATNTLVSVLSATNTASTTAPFVQQTYPVSSPIANLNSAADGARTVYTFTPPSGTPVAPGVAAGSISQTGLTLTITDNSTNEGYFVISRSTDNVTFTTIGTVATSSVTGTGGTATFAQTGLTAATTYYYRATAYNEAGGISSSGTTTATTLVPVPICGTKSVGPAAGADYATLTAAFSALSINGLCGPLVLELQSGYLSTAETFPLVYSLNSATATNTVTVRPAAGATGLSISSTAAQTLNINGGRYLLLDGRPGGSGSTVSGAVNTATDLIIINTSITGQAIQFTGDATFNTVQHCQVKGVGTSLFSYPDINFSSTVATNGNSDNTIRFNNIGDGATLPYGLMYSGSSLNARNTITDNNLFNYYGASSNTAAALYLSSAGNNWVVANNSIYQTTARAATGATHYGLYIGAGNGHTITGNFIGGSAPLAGGTPHTTTGTGSAYRFVGILLSTSGAATSVQNNTIANITWTSSSGATTIYGVLGGIYVSAGDANIGTITGNVIGTPSGPISVTISTAGGYSFGISTASAGTVNIARNAIGNITTNGSTAAIASNVAGILASAGAVNNITQNKLYALTAASGGASISTGIWLTGGTTNNINNNLVGTLAASASTSLLAVNGLLVAAGTTINIYHNTIYLNASSTGATFGTSGIYLNSNTLPLDLRNNIVVNKSTAVGTGGYTAALRRLSGTTGTAPTNLLATTNNNLYYAGTPSATNLIYVEGTTTATNALQTLAAYKALVANRDNAAVTEDVPFASLNGTDAAFLHISPATPTQVESAGTAGSGITTDFDGDTRNAGTPDIGADEGNFQLLDTSPPAIAFTALLNTSSTANRTLTATITDLSGVATGANGPRLFFRKGTSGAFVTAAAPTVSGSTYTFTFDYSLVGGVAQGDVIQYYVAAQDLAATPNAGTSPAGGSGATPPATPNAFTIAAGLSGIYYVGTSTSPDPTRTYATLTAAVAAYTTSGLSGAVTFLLLDNAYSTATGETFPLILQNNGDASATNTLTIKPNTGVTAIVTTAGNQLVAINARYIIIDGSNTAGGTTRDLTFRNSTVASGTYNLAIFSTVNQGPGSQFITFRNLNIVGGGTTTSTTYGFYVGNGPDNDNITLANNSVQSVFYGIYTAGTAAVSAGGYDNLQVVNNVVGPATAATANNIYNSGMYIVGTVGLTMTGNTVQNVVNGSAAGYSMVVLNAGNPTVSSNTIQNMAATSGGSVGMIVQGVTGGTFSQNTVQNITASTSSPQGMNFAATTGATISQNVIQNVNAGASGSNAFGLSIGSSCANIVADRNRVLNISTASTDGYGAKGIDVSTGLAGSNIRVSNNFVQVTALSGFTVTGEAGFGNTGIRIFGTTGGVSIYHNSVNLTGTDPYSNANGSAAFVAGTSAIGLDVRNNIFRNSIVNSANTSSKAYAFVANGSASAFTNINYNDYFVSGTQGVLGLLGTDRTTLAALRTATGQDQNSLNTDPTYTSVTDLHTAAPGLNGAGTPIAAVVVDIDGETRNATTPDIGADEFLTNLDISVAALTAPVANSTCFGTTETVTASITNSASAVLNFATNPVTVTVTITPTAGGAAQTFTTIVNTGTLAAGASQAVTFTGTANLSLLGTYTATVTTSLVGDDNPANNTLTPAVTITSGSRSAAFTYPTATICAGATGTVAATLGTGATAGTFTSTAGLTVDATTGAITPGSSTAGTYAVTNTLPATATCPATVVTQSVTITPQTTATFSYSGTTFCQTGSNATASVTGTAGGTFSVTPSGLTLDVTTGAITASSSTPGTYTVTYAVGTACPSSATQTVTITAPQSTAFTYPAGNNCAGSTGSVTATLGTGAVTGTFAATPAGLTINATTGAITLSTSAAGIYTVTNTLPAANGCALATASSTITLNATPSTAFAYSGGTFCQTGTNPTPTVSGAAGGTFSATPSGLSLDASTGAINLAASTVGTYTVNYAIAGTCAASSSTTVTVATAPSAAFSFAAGNRCAGTTGTLTPGFGTGSSAGTFAATPAGLTINASTGEVTLSTSTAGTYTITNNIAANGGCAAAIATQTLTLNAAPVATLTAGGATTFCQGGSVVLTASAGTGNTYQFFNGAASLGAASATNTLTASASGSYTVVVTNAGTCQATSTATVVTVSPLTTATFSYPGASFCQSGTTSPAATVTGTAGGAFSSTTGLTLNATTGAITLASSVPGIYTVTYAVGGACPSTSAQTVTITAAPLAAFSYPTTNICAGQTAAVTPTIGTGASAGTFTSTTGLTINATTGVITPSTSTAGTYTVTNAVAAANGCAAVTSTATVTITPATSAVFSYGTGAPTPTFCVSGTTNPTITLGTGAVAGTFSSTTGLTINATTGAITLSTSTPGTYTITNTVAGSCGSSATAQVTITAAPVAAFSYAPVSGCVGAGTATPTLGTGAVAGTFSSTTGLTISATTGVITLSTSTAGTYTVTNTVAASGGCAAVTSTSTFTVNPAAVANAGANQTICSGTSATLGSAAITGTTYAWSPTTGLSSATAAQPTVTLTNTTGAATTTTYTLTATTAGGCTATSTVTVTVNPAPITPTVTVLYPTRSTALLTSSVAPAGTTYQWYLSGNIIPGATSQTYTANGATAPGAYTVRFIATATGCQSAVSTIVTVTATSNAIAGASLNLYPNPTSNGLVTLELTGFRSATQLTVLDALGRVVTSQLLPANAGTATRTLDLSGVANGVYLLRLRNADGVETLRLVRE